MNARVIKRSPRVQVTLTSESMKLLEEVSALTGQGKATLISELVDSALPAIKLAADALRVVKDSPLEAQRMMSNYAARASLQLAQEQLDFDAEIDARTMKGKQAKRRASGRTP